MVALLMAASLRAGKLTGALAGVDTLAGADEFAGCESSGEVLSSSASAIGSGLPRRRGFAGGAVAGAGCSSVMMRGDDPRAHFLNELMSSKVAPSGIIQNSTRLLSRLSPLGK